MSILSHAVHSVHTQPIKLPEFNTSDRARDIVAFGVYLPAVDVFLLKSEIHRATVTAANVNYEGSLTISADLAELVELQEYERVLVGNLSNGERFETYAIYGVRNQGTIQLNGATAHLGKPGDRLTITSFGSFDPEEAATHQPRVVVLDEKNRVVEQP